MFLRYSSMSTPLAFAASPFCTVCADTLTDDQLAAVMRAAEPLAVGDRDAFLRDVAAALQGQELGDGAVYRTVAQAHRKYYDPPLVTAGPRWGR
jgi:hypothetical protein